MPLKECIICLEKRIVFVDSPCGHKEFCLICLNKIGEQANENEDVSKCPFCRQIFPPCISTHLYLTCNELEFEEKFQIFKNEINFQEKQNIVQFIAQNGNLKMLKFLFNDDPKLAVTCTNVGNALPHVVGCIFGHKEFVRYVLNFIKEKFLSNVTENIASETNNTEVLNITSLEPLENEGARAINECIRTQQFEIAEMLLTEFEMNPNLLDADEKNAFVTAVLANQAHWLEKNKQFLINIDAKNMEERTLLHISCLENNTEAIKFCIEQNADVNLKDGDVFFPLHYVMNLGDEPTVLENCQLLVNEGANVNIGNQVENGVPLLAHACSLNVNSEVIRYLIKQNVNIHEANEDGFVSLMSPLLESIENENIANARVLLEQNANPNDDRFQDLPLHDAVIMENEPLSRLLLSHNANPNLKNEDGYYPIEMILQNNERIVDCDLSQELLNLLQPTEENRIEILRRNIDERREIFLEGMRLIMTSNNIPNTSQQGLLNLSQIFYQNAAEQLLNEAQNTLTNTMEEEEENFPQLPTGRDINSMEMELNAREEQQQSEENEMETVENEEAKENDNKMNLD